MPDKIRAPKFEPKLEDPGAVFEGTIAGMLAIPDQFNPGKEKMVLTVDTKLRPHDGPVLEYESEEEASEYRTIFIGWPALGGILRDWHNASPIKYGEHLIITMTGYRDTDFGNPAYTWAVHFPGRSPEERPPARTPDWGTVFPPFEDEDTDTPAAPEGPVVPRKEIPGQEDIFAGLDS